MLWLTGISCTWKMVYVVSCYLMKANLIKSEKTAKLVIYSPLETNEVQRHHHMIF